MGFLNKLGLGSKTVTNNALSGQQLSDLNNAINVRGAAQADNFQKQQDALAMLLEGYDPTGYARAIRENSIAQANQAQNKLLSAAAGTAGSAFNTAAQGAAQRSTADAVAAINANAENNISSYKQNYLTNLLTQYGNQTAEYQDLLEQLLGQRTTEKKGSVLGKLIGLGTGLAVGGPQGGAIGLQAGDMLDNA